MSQPVELLSNLKCLLNIMEEYDHAVMDASTAEQLLNSNYVKPSFLEEFDSRTLNHYVEKKIGKKPIKPQGLIKLAYPVYLIKKRKYEADKAEYDKMRPLAEAAYREDFQQRRDELRKREEEEKAKRTDIAKKRLSAANERVAKASELLKSDTTISTSLKKKEIVRKLISYIEECRADNLKEAINLYYDEKRKDEESQRAEAHRQEMKALEEEKVRAAQAAEEFQRKQYEEAKDAAIYAQIAAFAVQDAADSVKDVVQFGGQSYDN